MSATNPPGGVAPQEHCFLSAINSASRTHTDLTSTLASLDEWKTTVERILSSVKWPVSGFQPNSDFVRQTQTIRQTLQGLSQEWATQRSALAHARDFVGLLDNKIILLIFGKLNVGKSAFCNLLAQRFSSYGEPVQHLYLDGGKIIETDHTFAEGETETTARLQGVRLGQQLVVLDTPGLHSVNAQNAELTKRFIESADGLLWLSSSASPGQTQELDELSTELYRGKPLLPVLTRSDVFEEDEVDGEIRKLLRNKAPDNRTLQENDVYSRAQLKLEAMGLDATKLVSPVSVSTYMAREEGLTPTALATAGFENLYAALLEVIQPALAYKQRKPAEVLLHHYEENVLGALHEIVSPQLSQLHASLAAARDVLAHVPSQVLKATWRKIAPTLPAVLWQDAQSGNGQALCVQVADIANVALQQVVSEAMPDYALDNSGLQLHLDLSKDTTANTDYEQLYTALKDALHTQIEAVATDLATRCQTAIHSLEECVADIQTFIQDREDTLKRIKFTLRRGGTDI